MCKNIVDNEDSASRNGVEFADHACKKMSTDIYIWFIFVLVAKWAVLGFRSGILPKICLIAYFKLTQVCLNKTVFKFRE